MGRFFLLVCTLFLMSSHTSYAKDYKFFGVNGDQGLLISLDSGRFYFTDSDLTAGNNEEFGAGITNCTSATMKCIALTTVVIAVPNAIILPPSWAAFGSNLRVVSKLSRGSEVISVVESTDGERTTYFTYSSKYGVETISLNYIAGQSKTYIAYDKYGLFHK